MGSESLEGRGTLDKAKALFVVLDIQANNAQRAADRGAHVRI